MENKQREIRFRAWDRAEKYITFVVGFSFAGQILKGTNEPYERQEDLILMQFTGLHDKNGKEIYEGDVVRVVYDGSLENAGGDDEVRQVKWGAGDEHYPAFDLEGNDMETNALSVAMHNGEIEVIGNIYENPELLKP